MAATCCLLLLVFVVSSSCADVTDAAALVSPSSPAHATALATANSTTATTMDDKRPCVCYYTCYCRCRASGKAPADCKFICCGCCQGLRRLPTKNGDPFCNDRCTCK